LKTGNTDLGKLTLVDLAVNSSEILYEFKKIIQREAKEHKTLNRIIGKED